MFFFKKETFVSQHIIMESLRLEEGNTVRDTGNPFRLKNELNYTAIKDIRNRFKLDNKTKTIKETLLRDIKNLF